MMRIAFDLFSDGLLTKKEALLGISPDQLNEVLHPVFKKPIDKAVLARGLAAAPGAAVGEVVFSPSEVEIRVNAGHDVILVRDETSPEDIDGMHLSKGILQEAWDSHV